MKRIEIIKKIEKRIEDLNYVINTNKSDDKHRFSWEYARDELQHILNMLSD